MLINIKHSRNINRMLKNRDRRTHRKFHLERAKRIREHAEQWREDALRGAAILTGLITEADIDTMYNNMLSEAIAEENSKCMDDRKH